MNPKVTVMMPAFNAGKYIGAAIESVLKQDFRPFELVVYDDGSTDGTYDAAKKYQADSRVRVYRSRVHRGVAHARNQVLGLARGRYLAPQDADDLMLAGRLERQAKLLDEKPEVGVVFGSALLIDETGRRVLNTNMAGFQNGRRFKYFLRPQVARRYPRFHPACMMARKDSILKVGGYDPKSSYGEDVDLLRKLWKKTKFYFLDRLFYIIREHPGRLSNRQISDKTLAACVLFYEKLEQTMECIQSLLPAGITIHVLNNASRAESRRILGTTFKDYPRVRIYDSRRNLGPAGGWNYLIRRAKEQWLLFLDNDSAVQTDGWLGRAQAHLRGAAGCEVLLPLRYNVQERRHDPIMRMRISGRGVFVEPQSRGGIANTFPAGAAFVRRALFKRLGLYDEKIFAIEDRELSIRALRAGSPIRALPIQDIEVLHDHRPAHNAADKKAAMIRYGHRRIQRSYERILEKHGLELMETQWKGWVDQQLRNMTRVP